MIVVAVGGLILLSLAIRQIGEYSRRNIFGRARERLFLQAFPDFCYQPFAVRQDIAGLANFPELAGKFKSHFNNLFLGGRPEIYNLICDQQDNRQRSVFDLRTISRGVGSSGSYAHTGTMFLIHLPEHRLTAFSLSTEGFGHMNLWGEDPDIDIDGEFVFSRNFFLTGPDRDAVTRLFDKSLVSFFRTNTLLFASGTLEVRERAILFSHAHELSPEDIRSMLDTLSKLIALLERQPEGIER